MIERLTVAQARVEKVNFSAGELTPTLRNRKDLAVHTIGLARLENMLPTAEGISIRRPGTQFVDELKDSTQKGLLLRFRYTALDGYLLCINAGVIRFFRDAAFVIGADENILELVVPWPEEELPKLRIASSGNAIYAVCGVRQPQIIRRLDPLNWTCSPYEPINGPVDPQNTDKTKTLLVAGTLTPGSIVTLTASSAEILTAADVGGIWKIESKSLKSVKQWHINEATMTVGARRRYNGNVYELTAGTEAGANPPIHEDGEVDTGKATWLFINKGYGFVRLTSLTDATHGSAVVLVELPADVAITATYRYSEPAWTDAKGWPEQISIHQNRLIFWRGPQFWGTGQDDFLNMDLDLEDDAPIEARLLAADGSLVEAQWSLSSGGILLMGSRDQEWFVTASNSASALTPTDINAIQDGTEGGAPHIPAIVDGGGAFIGKNRRRIHFADFSPESGRLRPIDLTATSKHLLKGRAQAIGWQRDEHRVLWIACENGDLRTITFNPTMDPVMIAAARQPMPGGLVEDVCVIPSADGERDEVYLIVARLIAGTLRRYIERVQPYFEPFDDEAPTALGAWFVDCGVRIFLEEPTDTITGLDHLEGELVAVHINGNDHPRRLVTDGAITLDRPVDDVLIGKPIPWKMRSLPLEVDLRRGSTKGKMKSSRSVIVDTVDSAGGFVRVNDGVAEELVLTGAVDYGEPTPLITRPKELPVIGPANDEATIEIFGDATLPVSISGLSPALDVSGM